MDKNNIFKLKGKTLVFIDWANVYGWFKSLKWDINPKKLFNFLSEYPEIIDQRFYFGIEKGNKKSENFQKEIKSIGFNLISKEVKFIPISEENLTIKRRKCDFDCEIVMHIMEEMNNFDGIILFSGDGDYKAIIEKVLDNKKQAIIVHPFGKRGREFNDLLKRDLNKPYFLASNNLKEYLK